MKICLIRHGETDWNVIGRLQGREDIPLNENGKIQARQCGLSLKSMNWTAIITSPFNYHFSWLRNKLYSCRIIKPRNRDL